MSEMNTFTCAQCKKTFPLMRDEKWNEEKAMEEYEKLHPEAIGDAKDIICDLCFIEYEEWLKKQTPDDKKRIREEFFKEHGHY